MAKEKRPNFLIIVADDLGYSDIGCFGSEINTPNLDKLAQNGARFTNYYTAAACSPTRAMLLSGTDNHIAGLGIMNEQKGMDPERWDVPGHEGYLNHSVAALSELLQDGGYHTLMSGKWHLGLKPEHNPHVRGFDRSYALLPGGSNHYGWEPQLDPKEDWKFFGGGTTLLYTEDGVESVPEANLEANPDGFFSSDSYTDKLIGYLDQRTEDEKEKPFFAFLPFSAPHWPLQCPKESREKYRGVYDEGPDALRLKRLEALKRMGIVKEDVVPHEVVAPPAIPEWKDMTEYQRKQSAAAMEAYAGMVDNIDVNLGKVFDYLKSIDKFDDTFIIFMSDNGAEGAAYEAFPVMGPNLMSIIDAYYDNSVENIGQPNSFVWYGPRWAAASTAPSRMYKMWSTEGGIKVPLVVHYPGFDKQKQGGELIRSFATVMDLCPTILELAGVQHPAPQGSKGVFRGREVVSMRGKSWVPFMTGSEASQTALDAIHDGTTSMGWELFGRAAVRQGRWKLVHVGPPAKGREDGKWQLYDIEQDPGEIEDLSEGMPKKYDEMISIWEEYRQATGVVWGMSIKFGFDKPKSKPEEESDDPVTQTQAWMEVRKDKSLDDTDK
ncbi:uncharacterized protein LTR77_000883 [Saxophila tyrrhenica]|uniref:Sulfatase N-terminal domain-containing protein n=1 Tax=Saxophila tyrrhenica TaxID=1690608 RepID=A0AAV9PNV8_9PEZI|nr:hypothetical protein LTR77_000883 [Saxophila tyrrhenica]